MTDIDDYTNQINQGDAREVLQELPENSVHFVMFSPPYWGLRDYGMDGQIGLEESLDAYIDEMVALGEQIKRVLRPDGSWYLNIGDSYASSPSGHKGDQNLDGGDPHTHPRRNDSELRFPTKCKMFMPHRVACNLAENGWILRSDAVWRKTNPMPEPVTDRLSTTFEWVFHLVQQEDYYYNLDAIREPYKEKTVARANRSRSEDNKYAGGVPGQTENTLAAPGETQGGLNEKGKNPGDVFDLATDGFTDGHFAVYPPELVESPVKSSCPPKVCADCGTPIEQGDGSGCDCETEETKPGIVLDPMCGRGTTCKVAMDNNRRYIGIELNPEYVDLADDYVPDQRQTDIFDYA